MTAERDFLSNLEFTLSAEILAALRKGDLDSPEALGHVPLERLERSPYNLTTGQASRLLAAAAAERLGGALLKSRGVDGPPAGWCAVGPTGEVDDEATQALRRHLATGAPVPPTWRGRLVMEVAKLGVEPLFCSPRTGRPLQDGRDDVTDFNWGALGRDLLRLVAFGFQVKMFEGRDDEAIAASVRHPGNRARLELMMAAQKTRPEDLDEIVVFSPDPKPSVPQGDTGGAPMSGNIVARLSDLFSKMFTVDELRRFLGQFPDGEKLVDSLPTHSSPADFFYQAAALLRRTGRLNPAFKERLLVARPRWADKIEAL